MSLPLQLGLEDLLGDLRYARRSADLGRLALLAYCEVRRWARLAADQDLATRSSAMIPVPGFAVLSNASTLRFCRVIFEEIDCMPRETVA